MELDPRSNTRSLDARAKRPRWTVAGRAHTRPPALRPRLARLVRARAGRESPPALAREDSPRGLSRPWSRVVSHGVVRLGHGDVLLQPERPALEVLLPHASKGAVLAAARAHVDGELEPILRDDDDAVDLGKVCERVCRRRRAVQ